METFTLQDPDGIEITVHRWVPPAPRAVLHVLHGWAEHAGRYDRFAREANAAGIAVYADDHRGHGATGIGAGGLGDLGPRGGDGVLDAVRAVSERAFAEQPDLPRLLLGHSWGSFLAQRYLRRWGDDLDAAVLTGTTLRREGTARREPANARFEPAATAYDWLSRDAEEVRRYVEDPWCGFERMAGATPSATSSPSSTATPAPARPADAGPDDGRVPPDLPVLVCNGSDDPIGGDDGGRALAEHYRAAGVRDVTYLGYAGARHELLNETNRDEVTRDLLGWLDARLATPRRTR